jgi:hypothetical protein
MEAEETEDTQEGMEGEGMEGEGMEGGAAGVPQPKKHKVRGEATVPHPSKEPTTEEGKLLIEPNGVE